MKKILCSLAAALVTSFAARAQDGTPKYGLLDNLTVGVSGNYLKLAEDLSGGNNSEFDSFDIGIGLSLAKQLNPIIEVRGDLLIGSITASSDVFYSSTDFTQFTGSARIYVTNMAQYNKRERKMSLYGSLGIGFISYKPVLNDVATESQLRSGPDGTDVLFPLGGGLEFRLNDQWNLDLNATANFLRTDKFDGYERGVDFDYFTSIGVGISYNLGKKKHVKWNNTFTPVMSKIDDNEAEIAKLRNMIDKQNSTISNLKKEVDNIEYSNPYEGPDADNDGVPDRFDTESNTPKGALVNFQGKEISTADATTLLPSVFFGINSAKVRQTYYEDLASVAKLMQENPSMKLNLVGYADKLGDMNYNQKIALKRANAVKTVLTDTFGIDASRLSVDSMGESSSFNNKFNKEANAEVPNYYDRRVDVRVK